MGNVCVCKDQFPAGKRSDDLALQRVGSQKILQGQVMHKGKVIIRIHLMVRLQTAQGGAIHFEILFTHGRHILFRQPHTFDHVQSSYAP